MPLSSSETSLVPPLPYPASPARNDGPLLEGAPVTAASADRTLRIRARRTLPVSRDELYAAWTRRAAWESWMRLRARSRATLAPHRGSEFRLELAEGPTIHVITGIVRDVRVTELLSLTWLHHTKSDRSSVIDVTFRSRLGMSELSIVHSGIGDRREAAWLMRLWTAALDRLASYFDEGTTRHALSA